MSENSGDKRARGRFQPGQSGDPEGKPRGARNAALVALDEIGTEGAEDVLRKAVEDAKRGNTRAAEVLLARVWPARKGPVTISLPPMNGPADCAVAVGAVDAAVDAGTLTPDEAQAVAGILDLRRRAIETANPDARITALEKRRDENR